MPRHDDIIDRLQEKPCWIIDFLPWRVPADAPGLYFRVEAFYLAPHYTARRAQQFANILLKLNCFHDISALRGNDEQWVKNPAPSLLTSWIDDCLLHTSSHGSTMHMLIGAHDTLFTITHDFTHMAVFNPSEQILSLLQPLVTAEGLFIRPAIEQ